MSASPASRPDSAASSGSGRRRGASRLAPASPEAWDRYRDNVARHLMGISRDLQARLMRRLSEECGYRALRPSLGTLLSLVYLEARPLGALATRLAITKQACSQLVAHAEGGGYVERRPDPFDRRSKHVVLTERGRALVEDAIRILFDCESIYTDVLGERAYRRFTRALARLFEIEVPSPAASELTERARRTIGVLPLVAERVQRDLMEATLAHGHRGLKMSHAQVLPLIGPEGARAHVLAKLQGVSRQAIHATARDLEELGILVREPDPRDGRGALLRLTRRGGRVLEDSVAAIEGLEGAFREVLGDAGYTELADGARQLFRSLRLEEEIFGAPSDPPATATPVAEGDTDIPRLARRLRRELGRRDAQRLAALLDGRRFGEYAMSYDWIATLVFVATLIATTIVGRFLVFQVPVLQRMRELNRSADKPKLARKRFREAVEENNRYGLLTNVVFYVAILPFCIDLTPRPWWRHVVDIVAVLLVFDFFYYWTHRFVFHGQLLRKVHALHHQARTPTYVDALYVHPLETFIGLCLFLGSIPLVAAVAGAPLSAYSMAIATLLFTQLNTLNHTFVDLPQQPWRVLHYITGVHAAHHVDMNQGNYATLTMFYDWLFGTYERPVNRSTP